MFIFNNGHAQTLSTTIITTKISYLWSAPGISFIYSSTLSCIICTQNIKRVIKCMACTLIRIQLTLSSTLIYLKELSSWSHFLPFLVPVFTYLTWFKNNRQCYTKKKANRQKLLYRVDWQIRPFLHICISFLGDLYLLFKCPLIYRSSS